MERRVLFICYGLYFKLVGIRIFLVMVVVLGVVFRLYFFFNFDNFVDCWNLFFICDGFVVVVVDFYFKFKVY